jgi:thiosulfate/3-mercaptopyruvate sulfurtransferase
MIPTMPVLPRRDTRSASGFVRPELLASTEWLAEQMGRPEIRVLDVRWRPDGTGRNAFLTGHIPGAVHLNWSAELIDRDDSLPSFLLAGPAQVAGALGRAGVGDGTSVVIYDDTVSLYAARTWWSLRVYGLESARILDGGFPGWAGDGHPVSNADVPPIPSSFTPRAQPRMRLTTSDVRGLIGSRRVTLLDARAPAEYRGLEGNARRLGHIPGAVNLPVAGMTEPGTQRLKSGDELRQLAHKVNVVRGRRLVCYDGSGIAAAKLAFVLTLLGHDDVAVYDGGWAEWGDRLDLPVER